MKKTKKDKEREARITMEIIVDANGPEEQAMGWYYYLEDKLHFPFTAICNEKRSISPLRVNDEVASYLNNRKRREITDLEEEGGMNVQILGSEGLFPEHLELDCRDQDGREIRLAT